MIRPSFKRYLLYLSPHKKAVIIPSLLNDKLREVWPTETEAQHVPKSVLFATPKAPSPGLTADTDAQSGCQPGALHAMFGEASQMILVYIQVLEPQPYTRNRGGSMDRRMTSPALSYPPLEPCYAPGTPPPLHPPPQTVSTKKGQF